MKYSFDDFELLEFFEVEPHSLDQTGDCGWFYNKHTYDVINNLWRTVFKIEPAGLIFHLQIFYEEILIFELSSDQAQDITFTRHNAQIWMKFILSSNVSGLLRLKPHPMLQITHEEF